MDSKEQIKRELGFGMIEDSREWEQSWEQRCESRRA